MLRMLTALCCLGFLNASAVIAQPEKASPALETTREFTITPAKAPMPLLQYELIPPLREQTKGNAAIRYLRAILLRPTSLPDVLKQRQLTRKLERWEEMPIESLPIDEIKEYLKGNGDMLSILDEASRCDRCDWELSPPTNPDDFIRQQLPQVSAQRELLRILSFRMRTEIAEQRFPQAIRSLQTGLRLGKHVGETPTSIQMLVGIAIVIQTQSRILELISQPGSPNLYWALSTLPHPLIDPKPALEGEFQFQQAYLPSLAELEARPLANEKSLPMYQTFLDRIDTAKNEHTKEMDLATRQALLATEMARHGPAAKKFLLARGRDPKLVQAMSDGQAVVIRALLVKQDENEEMTALFQLPYYEARPRIEAIHKRHNEIENDNKSDSVTRTLNTTFPVLESVQLAHARVERRFAQIRVLEAIRLHLAETGKLPKTLAEIQKVPLPVDPFTGRPFTYVVEENKFTLTAPELDPKDVARQAYVFKVTLKTP